MADATGLRLLVGYDGSPAANAAITAGAALIPQAHAYVTYLWEPPFGSEALRHQLRRQTSGINEFVAALEREGAAEAEQLVTTGTTVAAAAGWQTEAVVRRSYGGPGLAFAQIAEELDPDLILLGSRGLSGTQAVLGSVSDTVVHYAPKPALVVAYPLLTAVRSALATGPVVVGWDGSAGARTALETAGRLFPHRELLIAAVGDDSEVDGTGSATVVRLDDEHGVAEALTDFARTRRAALVVVGSRGRSMAREVVLGSVARTTVRNAHGPVMVVPRPAS